jgi:hypothetical protein
VTTTVKSTSKDAGTISALMIRLRDYRLPRAQRLLERVNRGELLKDSDLQFLRRVFDDSRDVKPLVDRNPGYLSLVTKMIDLYSEIVAKALENERNQPRV